MLFGLFDVVWWVGGGSGVMSLFRGSWSISRHFLPMQCKVQRLNSTFYCTVYSDQNLKKLLWGWTCPMIYLLCQEVQKAGCHVARGGGLSLRMSWWRKWDSPCLVQIITEMDSRVTAPFPLDFRSSCEFVPLRRSHSCTHNQVYVPPTRMGNTGLGRPMRTY